MYHHLTHVSSAIRRLYLPHWFGDAGSIFREINCSMPYHADGKPSSRLNEHSGPLLSEWELRIRTPSINDFLSILEQLGNLVRQAACRLEL